ncbi:MAG: aldo/keto reductase [Anaerolineae bacterium]|nr:aldo/keto reductase [Anaerolineae bacterium]
METRILGKTGLEISRLGIGLAEIGFELTLEEINAASEVLNTALDRGITFLDTSACYDISEELIGRTIAHRRDDYVLATKAGHVTGGYEGESWTAQTVRDSIGRSLVRMKTDHLDLVQLHSCDVDVLERGEVIEVLQQAKQAGKTRFIGYSGDNEAALWAVESGLFDTLQTSFNLVDQNARLYLFDPAKARGMGIICKRPIANGAWGALKAPSDYAANYFKRAQKMLARGPIPDAPENRILVALGFAFAHAEADVFIVGTRNPKHLKANIDMVNIQLPIAPEIVAEIRRRFEQLADSPDWAQRE